MKPEAELEGGFSRRAVGWIVTVSLISLVLGALLSAFGRNLAERPDAGANSFSRSAVGHRALVELLDGEEGLRVVSRRDLRVPPGPRRLLVLAEPLAKKKQDVARLQRLRDEAAKRQAPLVLVLPKWGTVPDPKNSSWIGAAVVRPVQDVEQVPGALAVSGLDRVKIDRLGQTVRECGARLGGIETLYQIDLQQAQLITPAAGLDPVVKCGDALLVARTQGAPAVYLVADPDLIENHGLGTADHAALIHDLLVRELKAEGVIFDETIHGFEQKPGLWAEALRIPLVFAFLQSLVLAGIVLWAGMGRFGKPLPARGIGADGPETLIDNLARLHATAERWNGELGGHRGHP